MIFRLFLISFLVLFSACQQKTEVIQQTKFVSDRDNMDQGGTDNTGGGNGIGGKPLDTYIDRNLQMRAPYVETVAPLIKALTESYPRLAADFYHLTAQRDWYFVPAALEEISKNILGTYAKTDQLALQDLNKIWIDKLKYDQMTAEDQGVLILHEIMMGVRLMQHKHRQDRCIAKAALLVIVDQNANAYQNEKNYCRKTYPFLDGLVPEKFTLTSTDYDIIRRLVSLLRQESLDIDEIRSLLENYRIRDYND